MNFLTEKNKIPVAGNYDVIIIGAGMAGIGAALAARRNGCKILLIEKTIMPGGLATAGFIAIYLSLCDGRGKKVTGGIAEELLHLSIKYGYNDLDPRWITGKGAPEGRYQTIFSPPEFIYALDELMESEGIDILYDTLFCAPVMDHGKCTAVIIENKSGRSSYKAKVFIDTSGDSDLFFRAGVKCAEEKNYLAYWFYRTDLNLMKKAIESGNVKDGISLEWRGSFRRDGSYTLGEKEYRGTNAKDVTRFVLNGRKILKDEIEKNKNTNGSLLALPGIAQFRRTRRIKGIKTIKEKDEFAFRDDSIGCIGHWLKPGIVYEVPYSSLIVKGCPNIIAAGRSISASDDAWEAMRVIPPAVLTGQAAGTAAALAIKRKCSVAELSVTALQKKLEDAGVILHYEQTGK